MNRKIVPVLLAATVMLLVADPAFAQDANAYKGYVGLGAGLGMGFATLGGALAQGMAAKGALEGIARNPGSQTTVLVPMVLGLALIESLVLFAWVIAFLLLGKIAG